MNRKLVNIVLIVLAVAIVVLIGKDFIVNKAGKTIENPYEYNIDEFRKVDSTQILFEEISNFSVKVDLWAGIAVDDTSIIIANAKELQRFNYSGKLILSKLLIDTATCVSVDQQRNIWIGMTSFVAQYDKSGELIRKFDQVGEKALFTSITSLGENIYVADAGNRIVHHYSNQGEKLANIGEKDEHLGIPEFVIPSPYFDVAIDAEGFLWAANTGRHLFENFNQDGSLRTSWGITSMKVEGFSGCCNPAHFAMMDDNSFVTSEKGMPRIKIYNQHGQFVGIVAAPAAFDGTLAPDLAIDKENRVIALDFERQQVRIFEKKKDGNK
jgi:hypothetical protein